jgi:hypothetical protein
MGYMDGVNNALIVVFAGSDLQLYEKAKAAWVPPLTAEEIASSLDRIYETPENRPIAIVNAMFAVCKRAAGTTESEVQRSIEDLRARAAK